jgi:hypothetical protein
MSILLKKIQHGTATGNRGFSLVFEGCFGKSGVQNVVI